MKNTHIINFHTKKELFKRTLPGNGQLHSNIEMFMIRGWQHNGFRKLFK